jgi:hypothetical protein
LKNIQVWSFSCLLLSFSWASLVFTSCREEVYEPMIWVSALSWGHITHYNLTASNRAWPHRTATNASSLTQALDSQALDYCL